MSTPNIWTIRTQPPDDWIRAAEKAVEINPSNSLPAHLLSLAAPDVVIPPEHLAVLTEKRWEPVERRSTHGRISRQSPEGS